MTSHIRGMFSTAVLVTLLLSCLLAAAPTSSAQPRERSPDETNARLIAETTGLSFGEAMRLIALDPHVQDLRGRLSEKYPHRLAGVWTDVEDHGRVKVAIAGEGAVPSDLKSGFPQPEAVDEIHADYPLEALDVLKERISDEGGQFRSDGFELVSVSIDLSANSVRVGAVDADRVRRELDKHYPPDRFYVVEEEPPIPAACTDRHNCKPWRGGINLTDIPPSASCSSAFSLTMLGSNYTSPLGYQYEGILTAGHCFGLNVPVEHDGETIGVVEYDKFAGSVDGAVVVHDVGFVDPSDIGAVIFKNLNDMWFPINSDAALSDGGLGSPICNSGVTRGHQCGTITDESYDFWYGITRFTDFRRSNICAIPGDSGGAVFYNNKAHGVINFGNFNSDGTCSSTPRTTYTQIYYVERDFNVAVQHAS